MKVLRKPGAPVEATQLTEAMLRGDEPLPPRVTVYDRRIFFLHAEPGGNSAHVGDWIVEGESYPVPQSSFWSEYETAEELP